MTPPRHRPRYWLHLPTGLAIDRALSPVAKYILAVANALPGGDPGTRRLTAAWPFSERTIRASWRELERSDVAAVIRRPGFRSRLRARGVARPGDRGRQRYARLSPELFYAALDAGTGRNAAYGPLLVSRLLRQQLSRGAAHVSPAVLAADLDLKPKLVTRLLDDLEAADVIQRHREEPIDSDELRLYTVRLAEPEYPVDLTRLDPEQSRQLEKVEIGTTVVTVLGSRQASALLARTLAELEENVPPASIKCAVGQAVADNLTGETMLVEDLLAALRTTLSAGSADTEPAVRRTPSRGSADTSIEVEEEGESVRADARSEEDGLHGEPQMPPAGVNERTVFEEGTIEAALPLTSVAILDAIGYAGVPAALSDELTQTLRVREAMNEGEPLSDAQLEIVDGFLAGRLRRLHDLCSKPTPECFAIIRAAFQKATHHDDLHDQLKLARRREPAPEPVIDILAGVGFRRAEDV